MIAIRSSRDRGHSDRGWLDSYHTFSFGEYSDPRFMGFHSLRVLNDHTVAYLDITGSGVETVAHLRENGRICVMFCSFDRRPTIVRLHGTGRAVLADDPGFDAELAGFGEAGPSRRPYLRGVIVVDVARVADSCGYAVPRMELVEERETLDRVWRTRDDERIATYHAERNATSLDGLPGLDGSAETSPPIPLHPARSPM